MAESVCPFCGLKSTEAYAIQLHIEDCHIDESPPSTKNHTIDRSSVARSFSNDSREQGLSTDTWTQCTRAGCGEYVLLTEIDEHLEVHAAILASDGGSENIKPAREENRPLVSKASPQNTATSLQKLQRVQSSRFSASRSNSKGPSLLEYFSGTSSHGRARAPRLQQPSEPGRLGRQELGPHAFEKAMPADVRRHLVTDAIPRTVTRIGTNGRLTKETLASNETAGLIPVLADLCAHDPKTEVTYLCHSSVKHVNKLRCDGNFCGYWNIQMLLTHIAREGTSRAAPQLPNVLELQETIEQAWKDGSFAHCRTETGGILGTRKWIGTSEAVAYFEQIGVQVEALVFKDDESELAALALLDHVEAYFMSDSKSARTSGTSRLTQMPPIYFQRAGHSTTIVGLERKLDGARNLLVFDPSFGTSAVVNGLLNGKKTNTKPETLLKSYRSSDDSLARWDEIEIIVYVSGCSDDRTDRHD